LIFFFVFKSISGLDYSIWTFWKKQTINRFFSDRSQIGWHHYISILWIESVYMFLYWKTMGKMNFYGLIRTLLSGNDLQIEKIPTLLNKKTITLCWTLYLQFKFSKLLLRISLSPSIKMHSLKEKDQFKSSSNDLKNEY
jgi:hypothetical protein